MGVYEGEKNRYFDRPGMSVQAIGVDIIETERIRLAIAHWGEHFLFRIFTPAEVTYCLEKEQAHYSFAARFAVKEAVIKAIGTGLSGVINTVDPVGGSYAIETLTGQIEEEVAQYLEKIESTGGMLAAIESHPPGAEPMAVVKVGRPGRGRR